MGLVKKNAIVVSLALTAGALLANVVAAQESVAPRENLMKVCGDKWRTVRDAEKTKQTIALEEYWSNTARKNYARAVELAQQAAALAK